MNQRGCPSDYSGRDYGLYQIYGKHILCGSNTLLYVGKAVNQTFAQRFKQHNNEWLGKEMDIKIYLGRTKYNRAYTKKDNWKAWKRDVSIAESIIIYKYSPNYNSACLGDLPKLHPYKQVLLIHAGERHKLKGIDNAPDDYV